MSDEKKTVFVDGFRLLHASEEPLLGFSEVVFFIHQQPGLVKRAVPRVGIPDRDPHPPQFGELAEKLRDGISLEQFGRRNGLHRLDVLLDHVAGLLEEVGEVRLDETFPVFHLLDDIFIRQDLRRHGGRKEPLPGFRRVSFSCRRGWQLGDKVPFGRGKGVEDPEFVGE